MTPDWKEAYRALADYGEERFGDTFWPGGDPKTAVRLVEAGVMDAAELNHLDEDGAKKPLETSGSTIEEHEGSPPNQEVLDLILRYGGIDEGHHKQWVLDQLVRMLADDYEAWVEEYEQDDTYEWDTGIPP